MSTHREGHAAAGEVLLQLLPEGAVADEGQVGAVRELRPPPRPAATSGSSLHRRLVQDQPLDIMHSQLCTRRLLCIDRALPSSRGRSICIRCA